MDAVLDYNQGEKVVVNDGSLHLVQLLRVFADSIILSLQEEVTCHQAAENSIAEELKAFIVVQVIVDLLVLALEGLVRQGFDKPGLAFEAVA